MKRQVENDARLESGEGRTVFRSEDYADLPIAIPEIPEMPLAKQKCCVVETIERLKEMLPKEIARQKITEEAAVRWLAELLRVAVTLDDADNFIDIRETVDPRAMERAKQNLRKLDEELESLKRRRKRIVR